MIMIRFHAAKILHTAAGPQELNVSFDIKEGDILTLYGPSGAGKTTILKMLAGLIDPTTGAITVNNQTWFDHHSKRKKLPVVKRPIGFVFQDFALFPNLTVRQNLEYAARDRKADQTLIDELIGMMQLGELQNIHPARLSGGQQQRVALARAIVRRPRLLLLDEPLSALDDEMRHHLQDHILQVHRRFNLTTILVSHYIPEICRLSNEVICLDKGRIIGQGSPQKVFLHEHEQKDDTLKIMGELLAIDGDKASILVASQLIQIPLTTAEAQQLQIGDKVILIPESLRLHLAPAISQLP